MSEELMKPGERQLTEIRSYLFDLLDKVNSLVEENRALLSSKGLESRLNISLELITMHRYDLDIVMKNYWNSFKEIINELKNIAEVKDKLTDILEDVNKIEELRKEAGL
jgi:regulator of replication initiation timing